MDINLGILRIRNFAELDEPGTPALARVVLPMPRIDAIRLVERAVSTLLGWRVESIDETAGTMHLTRRTRVFRFTDDIHLRLEQVDGGTRLHGRSKSRIGLTDLGQNRRNLLQLVGAVRASG